MNISPVGKRIKVYHWCEIVFILLCQSFQMESKTNESRIISADEVYINMSDELIHNPHVTALHKRFAHNYDFFHQRGIVHDSTSVMALAHHKRPCSSQAVPHILAKANAQHKRCLIPPSSFNRYATAAHVPKGCTLRKHSSYSPKAKRDAASEKLLFDGTRQYQGKHSSCTSRSAISESM